MCSQHYSKVAEHLSTLLLLDTEDRMDILMKRSRARAMMESWEDALRDADEVYSVSSHHVIRLFMTKCVGGQTRPVILSGP